MESIDFVIQTTAVKHPNDRAIPYRGKLRRGKVKKFSLSGKYFSPTIIFTDYKFSP